MNSYCILGPVAPLRGGIAQYTTLLAQELKDRGEVNVISFSRLYPSLLFPGKSQVVENGALKPPPNVEFCLDTMNPLTWMKVAKKIAAMEPDMLIVPLWVTFLVPPILAIVSSVRRHSSAKVLFICHNVIPHDVSRAHLLLVKMLLKKGDFVIVHSDQEMALVRSAVPTIRVMKHFLPTCDFFASAGKHKMTRDEARENLRIFNDKLALLFFGFVRRYKGLDLLIEAMPKVCKCVDAELLIVGEFWGNRIEYERMIDRVSLQENIRIIDRYVPDNEVALYFAAADIVILPYREATQSGVVQIAYAFGKPVITTDVGGLPEVVQDGRTGYVVPSENPDAIADAVLRFSRERASVDFAGSIEAEESAFSWAVITRSIEQCLM